MPDLMQAARDIADARRDAGHGTLTVWAALHYTQQEGSVNGGFQRLSEVRDGAEIPHWLIDRWARDAGILNGQHS